MAFMRSTCSELIDVLRGMTGAGESEYSTVNEDFFSDDVLQRTLDAHRLNVYQEPIYPAQGFQGTSYEYQSQWDNYEQSSGGTAIFYLEDGTGAKVSSALYSVDYLNGHITFTANTAGALYYLTGRSYDLNAAAAEVWRQKASQSAVSQFDWSTDNMSVKRSQVQANYQNQADYYQGKARPKQVTLWRRDINP
jgi:hypothetical protein